MAVTIYFDCTHLYYLTQYLPVYQILRERGVDCHFSFYREHAIGEATEKVIKQEKLQAHWVENRNEATELYNQARPEWLVLGNSYPDLEQIHSSIKTAQLYHGIGMKSDVYRPELMEMDIRFVEAPHYSEILSQMYPGRPMLEVGYAKLDPLFGSKEIPPRLDLIKLGLDPSKPILLYAPTYYPSSIELMPDNWPQEFSDYNLIVKVHPFTLSKPKYLAQRKKLMLWAASDNVHLPPADAFNLLPYYMISDLLISDASSALFEFAAMDKPVIWCDFLKVRWTHRGLLRAQLKKRLDDTIIQYYDICEHAKHYKELKSTVASQLEKPEQYAQQRRDYTARLIGKIDGNVSNRIAEHLLNHL